MKYKKKDCMNCKHCVLQFFAYHDGCANSCKYENEIAKLPSEELMEAIKWGTCKWFEEGEPTWSDELSYDD